ASGGLEHGDTHLLERTGDLTLVEPVDDRLIFFRNDALAEHRRHPARDIEQFCIGKDPRLVAELIDPSGETVWNAHVRALLPEVGIVALHRLVVKDDEVANPLEQALHAAVIFVALDRVEALVREQSNEARDAGLD